MEDKNDKEAKSKKVKKSKSKKNEIKIGEIFSENSEESSEEYILKRVDKIIESLLSEKT